MVIFGAALLTGILLAALLPYECPTEDPCYATNAGFWVIAGTFIVGFLVLFFAGTKTRDEEFDARIQKLERFAGI